MKVDNPRYGRNGLYCADCPFTDNEGCSRSRAMKKLCFGWPACPTPDTYDEACALAEAANR